MALPPYFTTMILRLNRWTHVNPKVLYDLLEKDFLPIVAPIGLDDRFQTYNINADDAACAIAKAVNAEKLAFLTDVEGIYKNYSAPSRRFPWSPRP